MSVNEQEIAQAVRAACLKAAQEACEDASISGLCATGALEVALGAIAALDLDAVIAALPSRENAP